MVRADPTQEGDLCAKARTHPRLSPWAHVSPESFRARGPKLPSGLS